MHSEFCHGSSLRLFIIGVLKVDVLIEVQKQISVIAAKLVREAGMGPALTQVLSGGLMPLHAGEIPLTLIVSKVDT